MIGNSRLGLRRPGRPVREGPGPDRPARPSPAWSMEAEPPPRLPHPRRRVWSRASSARRSSRPGTASSGSTSPKRWSSRARELAAPDSGGRARFECGSRSSSLRARRVRSTPRSRATCCTTWPTPRRSWRRQVELIRPGGLVVLLSDHLAPTPTRCLADDAQRHRAAPGPDPHPESCPQARSSTSSPPPASIPSDLSEEAFTLDFDEWFDRGTPASTKAEVRDQILKARPARGFRAVEGEGGRLTIHCWRAIVRGVKPLDP